MTFSEIWAQYGLLWKPLPGYQSFEEIMEEYKEKEFGSSPGISGTKDELLWALGYAVSNRGVLTLGNPELFAEKMALDSLEMECVYAFHPYSEILIQYAPEEFEANVYFGMSLFRTPQEAVERLIQTKSVLSKKLYPEYQMVHIFHPEKSKKEMEQRIWKYKRTTFEKINHNQSLKNLTDELLAFIGEAIDFVSL